MENTQGAGATITDLLIALLAKVLAKHPRMKFELDGEWIRSNPEINVSVAIAVKEWRGGRSDSQGEHVATWRNIRAAARI